jgi:hypothetical protein
MDNEYWSRKMTLKRVFLRVNLKYDFKPVTGSSVHAEAKIACFQHRHCWRGKFM